LRRSTEDERWRKEPMALTLRFIEGRRNGYYVKGGCGGGSEFVV
jgi:hypothetical protein